MSYTPHGGQFFTLQLPERRATFVKFNKLRVHTWRIAVLPPSCCTNPRGTAAIYLSSRRQPTYTPSRFSLSNHVPSSSGTPTHTVHLRLLPTPHLRRRGRGGSPTFGSSTTPRTSISTSISYLALFRPNSFLRHSLQLILQGPVLIFILTLYFLLFLPP